MEYYDRFMQIVDALEKHKVEYILVGGFALILYGLPRLTEDIDLFIRSDEGNINLLKQALLSVFNDESINEINAGMLNDYPVIRYGSPDGFYIDILAGLGEAFTYDDLNFVIQTIQGHRIRIATPETLYAMKRDTVKPVDKADSVFLKKLLDDKKIKSDK